MSLLAKLRHYFASADVAWRADPVDAHLAAVASWGDAQKRAMLVARDGPVRAADVVEAYLMGFQDGARVTLAHAGEATPTSVEAARRFGVALVDAMQLPAPPAAPPIRVAASRARVLDADDSWSDDFFGMVPTRRGFEPFVQAPAVTGPASVRAPAAFDTPATLEAAAPARSPAVAEPSRIPMVAALAEAPERHVTIEPLLTGDVVHDLDVLLDAALAETGMPEDATDSEMSAIVAQADDAPFEAWLSGLESFLQDALEVPIFEPTPALIPATPWTAPAAPPVETGPEPAPAYAMGVGETLAAAVTAAFELAALVGADAMVADEAPTLVEVPLEAPPPIPAWDDGPVAPAVIAEPFLWAAPAMAAAFAPMLPAASEPTPAPVFPEPVVAALDEPIADALPWSVPAESPAVAEDIELQPAAAPVIDALPWSVPAQLVAATIESEPAAPAVDDGLPWSAPVAAPVAEALPALPWAEAPAARAESSAAPMIAAEELQALPWFAPTVAEDAADADDTEAPAALPDAPRPFTAAAWGLPWQRPTANTESLSMADPALWATRERMLGIRDDLTREGAPSFGAVKSDGSGWLARLPRNDSPP